MNRSKILFCFQFKDNSFYVIIIHTTITIILFEKKIKKHHHHIHYCNHQEKGYWQINYNPIKNWDKNFFPWCWWTVCYDDIMTPTCVVCLFLQCKSVFCYVVDVITAEDEEERNTLTSTTQLQPQSARKKTVQKIALFLQ